MSEFIRKKDLLEFIESSNDKKVMTCKEIITAFQTAVYRKIRLKEKTYCLMRRDILAELMSGFDDVKSFLRTPMILFGIIIIVADVEGLIFLNGDGFKELNDAS